MKTTDEPMQAVAKMHPHTRKVATVLAEKRQTPVQEQLEFADELCCALDAWARLTVFDDGTPRKLRLKPEAVKDE